jgi:hypothetical protein
MENPSFMFSDDLWATEQGQVQDGSHPIAIICRQPCNVLHAPAISTCVSGLALRPVRAVSRITPDREPVREGSALPAAAAAPGGEADEPGSRGSQVTGSGTEWYTTVLVDRDGGAVVELEREWASDSGAVPVR